VAIATDVLEIRLLHPGAVPPARSRPGDAGYDLRAVARVRIPQGGRRLVGTGVAVALPPGVAGLVTPRSGLALEHGITVLNGPGLVDLAMRAHAIAPQPAGGRQFQGARQATVVGQ